MELTTEKLNVKIDGVAYSLSYPTVKQMRGFEKKGEEDVGIDDLCSFLVGSGLPKEVVENLQANHMNQIVGGLMGKQKS